MEGFALKLDEFLNMPDDGNRYELVDGEMHMFSTPSTYHQVIVRNVVNQFSVRDCGRHSEIFLGPINLFILGQVLTPDFLFVRHCNLSIVTRRGIEGTPDLVGEVVSSSNTRNDLIDKLALYERTVVKEYWILYPEFRMVEQYIHNGREYSRPNRYVSGNVISSNNIPYVEIKVDLLFETKLNLF